MFQKMKNIDTAFRHIRVFCLLFLLGCLLISGYALYMSHKTTTRAQDKVYVLANGKALEAYAAERRDNLPVEARDHIKMFHYYFFTLDPDEQVIQRNIAKALYLADGSAKQQYDNLKENNYYTHIISGNISQQIEVDSIVVDSNQHPFYFTCYARQKIIRPTTISTRSLITEGRLRQVARSDNNAHGFLIEKWKTLENNDLKVENR